MPIVLLRAVSLVATRMDPWDARHPFITLAIRLQFEFAAWRSEIIALEWNWIDFPNRRVVWPDSKTGGMSKPLSTAKR